ncbi:hypothetical protein CVT26_011800 [Gymnopilus dilepis]|uniref:Uncharacterized protein n=1 Tax=Gymnopilus dilepis TaxID=231916 RepID=A0A409WCG7_9AGAR|nr:hypothetical protein CVT26_011800 [Gymnopilus dilepis]
MSSRYDDDDRRRREDDEMRTEERVQSYTPDVEPSTGDKWQRDRSDDSGHAHPSSRSNSGQGNGNGNGPMPMMNGGYIPVGGGAQAGMDALYIGAAQAPLLVVQAAGIKLE